MKAKWLYLTVIILLVLSFGAHRAFSTKSASNKCESYTFSKVEAGRIAAVELANYSKRNNLSPSDFSAPVISKDGERIPWIFDFTSNSSPRHFIRIQIDKCGNVEESSEILN
jgi:hypothetical protein